MDELREYLRGKKTFLVALSSVVVSSLCLFAIKSDVSVRIMIWATNATVAVFAVTLHAAITNARQ